ncbi:MAG: SLBB domain-containing protein [FCB group bacterium]|nr:SLBB domain-containing protein [FCB group bacterium]
MRRHIITATILLVLIGMMHGYAAEQRISAGSVINITVLDYAELSKTVVVRQDGTIEYPLLSNIPINGMTPTELHNLLFPILSLHVERPQLFLSVAEYTMVLYNVQGQVNSPGSYNAEGPLGLQRAITLAGNLTMEADISNIIVIRKENRREINIKVDLSEFLYGNKDWSELLNVQNGDVIIVPSMGVSTYVRIIGAVRQPGTYYPIANGSIMDQINLAGGVVTNGNLNDVIYITYGEDGFSRRNINIKKFLKEGKYEQLPIAQPGDIIIVNEYNEWQRIRWWAQITRDLALILSTAVILSRL